MFHLFEKRAMACMSTSYEKDQYTEWEMRYMSQKKKERTSFMREETEIKADINSYSNSIITQN